MTKISLRGNGTWNAPGSGRHVARPLPEPEAPEGEKTLRYALVTPDDRKQKLQELLRLLRKGKWVILLVFLAVTGAVAAYVFTSPASYEAHTVLLIETGTASKLGVSDELGLRERTLTNELVLLQQSFPIAVAVAARLLEAGQVPETGEPLSAIRGEDGGLLPVDEIAARLQREYVEIEPMGKDVDMIRIGSTSRVPAEAALIANVYSEEYILRTQESSRAQVMASRDFLEAQERKLQRELKALEDEIRQYMSTRGAAALEEEAKQTVAQVAQLEAMRDEVHVEEEMRSASLRSLEARLAEIEPNLVQRMASSVEGELKAVQDQVVDLELHLNQIYRRDPGLQEHPTGEIEELSDRLDALRQTADRLARRYVGEVLSVGGIDPRQEGSGLAHVGQYQTQIAEARVALSGLEAKARALDRRLREYEQKLRRIPGQAITLAQLQRERQAKEELYLTLVQKLQEARVTVESELGYAEVIRPAFVPLLPVSPNIPRSLFLAAVFGLGLGVGIVLLRKLFDTRLHEPGDLHRQGQYVLGMIPDMEQVVRQRYDGQGQTEFAGRRVSTALIMLLNPEEPLAEAWRQLRTNIRYLRVQDGVRTLLVTSPQMREGKSTVAANLALAMAHAGRRVVLVDGDLRQPRVHRMLGLPRGPGLVHVLGDPYCFDPEFFSTDIPNFYVIPAGSTVPNPGELLGSPMVGGLIDRLRQAFDLVIIDAPPVLGFSDAALLATCCDGTALVVHAGKTDVRAFEGAVGQLEGVQAAILGCVLNRMDPKSSHYSYGYRTESGYRQEVMVEARMLPAHEDGAAETVSPPGWQRPYVPEERPERR